MSNLKQAFQPHTVQMPILEVNNAGALTKYLFWNITHQLEIFQMPNQTHQDNSHTIQKE
jgi:hypothetical protein